MNDPQMIDLGECTPEELIEASRYSVEIHWSPEDQIFIADVPELPGIRTHGATQRRLWKWPLKLRPSGWLQHGIMAKRSQNPACWFMPRQSDFAVKTMSRPMARYHSGSLLYLR